LEVSFSTVLSIQILNFIGYDQSVLFSNLKALKTPIDSPGGIIYMRRKDNIHYQYSCLQKLAGKETADNCLREVKDTAQLTSITFAISGTCPAFSSWFVNLNKDIGQNMIDSHKDCLAKNLRCTEMQERKVLMVDGIEFRTELDLKVEAELGLEFPQLLGLLVATVRDLFGTTRGQGFETVFLSGEIEDVRFDTWWTWTTIEIETKQA
jgi:hypothetical protein